MILSFLIRRKALKILSKKIQLIWAASVKKKAKTYTTYFLIILHALTILLSVVDYQN